MSGAEAVLSGTCLLRRFPSQMRRLWEVEALMRRNRGESDERE